MVTSDLGHNQYWRTLFLNVTLFWRNDPVLGGSITLGLKGLLGNQGLRAALPRCSSRLGRG